MKSILMLFMFLLISFSTDAQVNIWKKKLEEKLAKQQKKSKQSNDSTRVEREQPAFDLSSMFGNTEELDMEEKYVFDFQIDWLVESSEENQPTELTQYFSTKEEYVAMQVISTNERHDTKDAIIVMDLVKNYMVMFNEKEKQAIVMSTAQVTEPAMEGTDSAEEGTITKTGKTKTIATFFCEQYLYKNKDGHGEFWTTKDLKYENANFFSYYQKMNRKGNNSSNQNYWLDKGVEGYVLEIKGTNNEEKTFHMVATSVNKNANMQKVVSDYEVMNMTGMGGGYPSRD